MERCAYAGLSSAVFYAAYDLVGARFLWWTWHTTDAATIVRWCGVPVGSTMWTLVHVFVFTYVLHAFVFRAEGGVVKKLGRAVVSTAICTTPLMMAMMSPFQLHQLEVGWGGGLDFR